MNNYIFITTVIATICFIEVNALKCWRCSSDATGSEFCNDPFDETLISTLQQSAAFQECSVPSGNPLIVPSTSRPVCKKLKQLVHDKIVVSRSCFWEDYNEPADRCLEVITPSYVRTEFCETCDDWDGCNTGSIYGPILMLLLAAIAASQL